MDTNPKFTPLFIHTHDSLCAELVSGRSVSIDEKETLFSINSNEARVILDWYRRNRNKWAGRVTKEDIESFVDQIDKEPPIEKQIVFQDSPDKKVIHLAAICAYRFAGIHKFGSIKEPPEEFRYEFTEPLTLIEGANGAGKTSLLNAITWCLTGYVHKPNRQPEKTSENPLPIKLTGENDIESEAQEDFDINGVTPLPPSEILKSLGKDKVPLDTWVELTFKDDQGDEVGKIRRSIKRTARGKCEETTCDNFEQLGLDPITREVGTRMPGILPYLKVQDSSDLGMAVATLTGIKPLQELVKHASNAKTKLTKDLVRDREKDIKKLDDEYLKIRTELETLLKQHLDISPTKSAPPPGPDKGIEEEISSLNQHFVDRQTNVLQQAKSVLGESFDPANQEAKNDLFDSIPSALEGISEIALNRLDSIKRLKGLESVTEDQQVIAEKLIKKLCNEAGELAELQKNPNLAARQRLYARVAGWLKGMDVSFDGTLINCPVCQSDLHEKVDPVTSLGVREHILEHIEKDSRFIEKTLDEWCTNAEGILRNELPEPLRQELAKSLPEKPSHLLEKAVTDELFEANYMKKSLAPLNEDTKTLCSRELDGLPSFKEPTKILIPDIFGQSGENLCQYLDRAIRAVHFASWLRNNAQTIHDARNRIVGNNQEFITSKDLESESINDWPLSKRLLALKRTVKSADPLTISLEKVNGMSDKLKARRALENRVALYGRAASCIVELISIGKLVDTQVATLMMTLSSSTSKWKEKLYSPAFTDTPKVVSTDVRTDGSLAIDAEARGTRASAYEVSNASDLRATLLAFLLSFWKYLLDKRGGLSLLLLDDLQELFDKENRRRVANTIPEIVTEGGRVIATTNDHDFGRRVNESSANLLEKDSVDRRCVHPLNAIRNHIELGIFLEKVHKRRGAFKDPQNDNDHGIAQFYVNNLRIYLENRLLDFFSIAEPGIPAKPTFADLLNAIRKRVNNDSEPFASMSFKRLAEHPNLNSKSKFVDLLNLSHHGRENEITFNDVKKVEDICLNVIELVQNAHEDYERWLRKDVRDSKELLPNKPQIMNLPSFTVPVYSELAAFSNSATVREIDETTESFSGDWFNNKALYYLHTHNLGFSAKINNFAIVDLSEEPIEDGSLVIALHKDNVYARRLLRSIGSGGIIGLGSEAENPTKRAPSLLLPSNEVQLLKVVGIVFNDNPVLPRPNQEAKLMNACELLQGVEIAFKVHGNSAEPLALAGQLILGGPQISPTDLNQSEGNPAAVAITDGAALKRVGRCLEDFPYLRYFESIGGLGESLLVRTEDVEGPYSSIPLLVSARSVIGVLYS